MSVNNETSLVERLSARFGDMVTLRVERNEVTAEVAPADLIAVATALRDEPGFRFTVFVDTCGIDYAAYGKTEWDTDTAQGESFSRGVESQTVGRFAWEDRPRDLNMPRRFAAIVHLLSIELNQRIRLRVFCEDDNFPVVPSLTHLWAGANWFEREAFDLYGIIFDGHPDLRRILTDYGFIGHPFRKDFPLIGNVEVRYDAEQRRVVYEPVSIEPRVLVPRTIRNDADLDQARAEAADRWREN
jgi:NADH-quinone oxidoreductase subunit C